MSQGLTPRAGGKDGGDSAAAHQERARLDGRRAVADNQARAFVQDAAADLCRAGQRETRNKRNNESRDRGKTTRKSTEGQIG